MAKITIKPNPRTTQVFKDLDSFLAFCKRFGYPFDEADLYNRKSYAWQQYGNMQHGRQPRDMWQQAIIRGVR